MAEAQTSYTQLLTLYTLLCKESAFPFPRISVAWWMLADSLVGFARCPLWEAVSIHRSYLLSSGIMEASCQARNSLIGRLPERLDEIGR